MTNYILIIFVKFSIFFFHGLSKIYRKRIKAAKNTNLIKIECKCLHTYIIYRYKIKTGDAQSNEILTVSWESIVVGALPVQKPAETDQKNLKKEKVY